MQFVILTGMSGAGKSTVLKFFEDLDFFCIDNLPPSLIPKIADVCFREGSDISRVALGIDIRGGRLFDDLFNGLRALKENGYDTNILFLDASDEVIIKRFKETRRVHPLAKNERIENGIAKEREFLAEVKTKSNFIIDTTNILTRQLKEKIKEIFVLDKSFNSLMINVVSFGYKYGIPSDSDLVFDVRFIPNPFYVERLRQQTGNDLPVKSFVMAQKAALDFLELLKQMVTFLIPNYINEGKNQLVISIGCTGGKHRSVTLANELYEYLKRHENSVIISHRDIDKD